MVFGSVTEATFLTPLRTAETMMIARTMMVRMRTCLLYTSILFDGGDAFAGVSRGGGGSGEHEVGVGPVARTAHAAAELVKVRQALSLIHISERQVHGSV